MIILGPAFYIALGPTSCNPGQRLWYLLNGLLGGAERILGVVHDLPWGLLELPCGRAGEPLYMHGSNAVGRLSAGDFDRIRAGDRIRILDGAGDLVLSCMPHPCSGVSSSAPLTIRARALLPDL